MPCAECVKRHWSESDTGHQVQRQAIVCYSRANQFFLSAVNFKRAEINAVGGFEPKCVSLIASIQSVSGCGIDTAIQIKLMIIWQAISTLTKVKKLTRYYEKATLCRAQTLLIPCCYLSGALEDFSTLTRQRKWKHVGCILLNLTRGPIR